MASNSNEFKLPRCLGRSEDLPAILQNEVVDEVVVVSALEHSLLFELAQYCLTRGTVLSLMLELPPPQFGTWNIEHCGDGTFRLSLAAVPRDALRLVLKRVVDIGGALVGLILCSFVYIVFGHRLRRETGATTLFAQRRVGQNGRRFTLYKFRTMYYDAEERLQDLRRRNFMKGPMFKLPDDPRITSTGRRLRSTHLDELPQFWNVVKGEMSLVGKRPPTEAETAVYALHHQRRLSMKPGITGLWQLHGNGTVSDFEQVVKLDCEYIDNWSLWLDFKIMARTLMKMLGGGAW
jgi:lipopolysaccharide/colanic/teichoic acid biosynthesis glycosyltransferase